MRSKKIAVLAVMNKDGEQGGAENFYKALTKALCEAGAKAEQVNVVGDESTFESIKETYLRFYDLDLSDYDGVISTKAPGYVVRHPNHITYLQHTMRVFYDMFEVEFPEPSDELLAHQELILQLDAAALAYPRTKKVFVIGHEVRQRLLQYINVDSEVIHESLYEEKFMPGEYRDYLYMPGRLHRWKRIDLIIKAMKYINAPLVLKISGIGESGKYLKELAEGDPRIEFLGRVSDKELVDYYANALAIPFVPLREDFGLVTLEAFRSAKPVITCIDSGEPTFFVENGENGFVCPPNPKIIASKIEWLLDHRDQARRMGVAGGKSVKNLTWDIITEKILAALDMNDYT